MTEESWDELGAVLHAEIRAHLVERMGFSAPTTVQRRTIPFLLQGKDVAVESCTGSGKTFAFVIPALQSLLTRKSPFGDLRPRCLIIAPTRELALQLRGVVRSFCVGEQSKALTVGLVCGGRQPLGVSASDDPARRAAVVEKSVSGHMLVATPGRLAEVLALDRVTGARQLSQLQLLVLDEADRFLLDELAVQLSSIHGCLPKQRQTALFSATLRNLSPRQWVALGLRDAVRLTLRTVAALNVELPPRLSLRACLFPLRQRKMDFLLQALARGPKAILFVNTCHAADFYRKLLQALLPEVSCRRLHGQMKQRGRERVLAQFSAEDSGLLVTTDVAARGLDVPHVDRIFVLDVPQRPSELIHRVGRTARGDRPGTAYVLLLDSERALLDHFVQQSVHFAEERPQPPQAFWDGCKRVMPVDRDFFFKARKAMVSFLRSYREHELGDALSAEALDLEDVARSFGLPLVPRLAESRLGRPRVLDADFLALLRAAPFADSHQQTQVDRRSAQAEERRGERLQRRQKAAREARQPQNRSFTERKHAKERACLRDSEEVDYEERLARRVKRGTLSPAEFERLVDRLNARYEA